MNDNNPLGPQRSEYTRWRKDEMTQKINDQSLEDQVIYEDFFEELIKEVSKD